MHVGLGFYWSCFLANSFTKPHDAPLTVEACATESSFCTFMKMIRNRNFSELDGERRICKHLTEQGLLTLQREIGANETLVS